VQEEVASSAGARHLARTLDAPNLLVVGEPSAWDGITLGYKGYLRARLTLSDSVTHTAHDARTVPARAGALWNRVEAGADAFDAGRARAFERLLPALLDLACTSDGKTASAVLDLSLRLPLDLPPDAAVAWLAERTPEATLEIQGALPAWSGPRTTPLHRAFARAISRQGGRARYQQKTGTADLNILAPAWGCPALAYGPGDAALDHTPEEHMPLDELARGVAVLTEALTISATIPLAEGAVA
jgi:LysW-gamma-L-lysine carboxypeptidase